MNCKCCCPVVSIILGILLICAGLIVQFAIVPAVFKQNLEIKDGSLQYKNWYKPEVPVYMQWYVFNLTNVENVTAKTEKPRFVQLGPYTYRENRWKTDLTWHTNGTVTYKNLKWWNFIPEKSNGTEEDLVWSVNLPLVTVAESFKYESFIVKEAFSLLAKSFNEGLFKNYTMKQLIWGYHDPMMHQAMSLLPSWFYTDFVGVYAGKNYTDDGVWTVSTGAKDISTVGLTQAYNGTKHLSFWSSSYANMVNGSDGTVGQPGLTKDDSVYFFTPDLCRSLYGKFAEEEKTPKGITLYRVSPVAEEMYDASHNPDNAGFCTPPGNCLLGNGMLNLTVCQKLDHFDIPVIGSMPHFLYADPKYLDMVEGLHPVESEHRTDIAIEPRTGIVMRVAKRLQVNMYLKPIQYISALANVDEIVFPVAWLNESAMIDSKNEDTFLSMMQLMDVADILCYVMYGVGAFMVLVAVIYLIFYSATNKNQTGERQKLLGGGASTAADGGCCGDGDYGSSSTSGSYSNSTTVKT